MLLLWAISAEMYPTNLRGQACGFFFTVANSVALLAPFVAPLAHYWKPLPMLLFSVPCFVISGLTRYLPETKSVQLPQTMKDTDDGIDTWCCFDRKKIDITYALDIWQTLDADG